MLVNNHLFLEMDKGILYFRTAMASLMVMAQVSVLSVLGFESRIQTLKQSKICSWPSCFTLTVPLSLQGIKQILNLYPCLPLQLCDRMLGTVISNLSAISELDLESFVFL